MNRNSRITRSTRGSCRNKVLVGAIVAALALGTAGTGMAQSIDHTLSNAPSWSQTLSLLNYVQSVNNAQTLSGNVGATLGAGNSIFDNFSGTAQPQTVSNNSLSALAKGNDAPVSNSTLNPNGIAGNYIQLELLGADGAGNSGLGIGSAQLFDGNATNAAVTTNVTGVSVATTLTGYASGNVTHSDNQIRSDVRVNDASNAISGNLPATSFTGTTAGSASIASFAAAPATTLANAGNIAIGNAQMTVGGNVASGVTLDTSSIGITDTVGGSATFTNSGNTIAGSYVGNNATSSFAALGANGTPSYTGSVVVSNSQRNQASPSTLDMQGDAISTDIAGNLTGAGSITQSDDTMSALVQGNSASNGIRFADGINIGGTGAATASSLDLHFHVGAPFVEASAGGDLVLLNMQRNAGAGGASVSYSASLSPSVGAGITATANGATADGTAVTLANDHATASVGGSAADNSIRASGASFDALVSAGSQQVTERANFSASTTGVNVRANLDASNGNQGDISIGASSIEAAAQVNQASTRVDVAGTAFASGSGVATATADYVAANYIRGTTGNAGVSVGNVQANYTGATATQITATNTDSFLGANYQGSITDGSSTVNGNAVLANAGANAASTSARLGGTNGSFTAGLVNHQYANTDTISGAVNASPVTGSPFLGIFANAGISNATLTVNSNRYAAGVNGNDAGNTLSTAFTNATAGDGLSWSARSASLTPTGALTPNAAHATLALASNQVTQNTAVTALADYGVDGLGVLVTGDLDNSPTTVDANVTSASAVANRVDNRIEPGVGNLTTVGGVAAQVAALSNFQFADADTVSAQTSLFNGGASVGSIGFAIQFFVTGTVSDSATSVSNNTASAFAAGTQASNAIAVTGVSYSPAAQPAGAGVNDDGLASIATTAVSANAAWTLLNAQGAAGGSRSATVADFGVGVLASVGLSNSPLSIANNQLGADARDHYASNDLSLTFSGALNTTAALLSTQGSTPGGAATAVTSRVAESSVFAVSFGNATGSDVTVSENVLTSTAIANTAINTLDVAAAQLAGSGFITTAFLPTTSDRGAVFDTTSAAYQSLADYGLTNLQRRNGSVDAAIVFDDAVFGNGAAAIGWLGSGNFNGGSLTVSDNTQTALAQANSASNALGLDATSTAASAAALNVQIVDTASDATASITNTDGAFIVNVGGALGTTTAVPVTVGDNTLTAQAGLNTASNTLAVDADSAITGTGVTTVRATTDTTLNTWTGAIADYAVYSQQTSSSGADATADAGVVGILAGAGIGNGGATSGLTVGGNHVAAQASGNSAGNALDLGGASSISATTALNNTQTANADAFNATTRDTSVGVYDSTGAVINRANLSVSGNSLDASASANSASNVISVLPTALNSGINQATGGAVIASGNTATASNALLNSQSNAATASATVQNSNIGINAAAPGAASRLLASVATVGDNSATASASGNSAGNAILLASLPTGVASSALVSNQLNSAAISATATSIGIGVNAGNAAASTSPVTVSGNTIGAIGVGNSATNHIGIGN